MAHTRKIKLHFNRVAMQRRKPEVWSAHTSAACNGASEVLIRVGDKVIGRTVFNPDGQQPRAYVEFFGNVIQDEGRTVIQV